MGIGPSAVNRSVRHGQKLVWELGLLKKESLNSGKKKEWEAMSGIHRFLLAAICLGAALFLMVVPAAVFNLLIFRYTPRSYNDMAITGAMNAWLAMNALWIVADLRGTDSLVPLAKFFLLVGIALLISVGVRSSSKETLFNAIRRFRRFRLRKR